MHGSPRSSGSNNRVPLDYTHKVAGVPLQTPPLPRSFTNTERGELSHSPQPRCLHLNRVGNRCSGSPHLSSIKFFLPHEIPALSRQHDKFQSAVMTPFNVTMTSPGGASRFPEPYTPRRPPRDGGHPRPRQPGAREPSHADFK